MILEVEKYTYRVMWSEEDEEFVGSCAEFYSLSWLAPTPEGALKGIRYIVKECIEDMIQNNEEVPSPIFSLKYNGFVENYNEISHAITN